MNDKVIFARVGTEAGSRERVKFTEAKGWKICHAAFRTSVFLGARAGVRECVCAMPRMHARFHIRVKAAHATEEAILLAPTSGNFRSLDSAERNRSFIGFPRELLVHPA